MVSHVDLGPKRSWVQVFGTALKLGLTSFGGPVAHLGYFHAEYVNRKQWLDEAAYTDLVALCQVLPGPTSSQLGVAIGTLRAGFAGALAAWVGFTLPSAVLLTIFALVFHGELATQTPWLHGLQLVAVAVVFQAVLTMATRLV
ncbi:MAG TPA: chromate transporter, partial [Spirochaetia bacterium]|nr:chromate transporter [Spirochaetia bacterium]